MRECVSLQLVLTLVAVLHVISARDIIDASDNCQYNAPTLLNYSTTQLVSLPHKNVSMNCNVTFTNSSTASAAVATVLISPQRKTAPANSNLHSGNIFSVTFTISNVTKLDQADYTLIVMFENCSFPCPTISLSVEDECYGDVPEPMTQQNVTVTTPLNAPSLKLVANFSGDTIEAHYRVMWSNSSVHDLQLSGMGDKYYTKRRIVSACTFAEELEIRNISRMDGGLYMARAVGSGYNGNMTFFKVIIENGHDDKVIFSLFSIIAIFIMSLVMLGICICAVYTYKKKKKNRPSSYTTVRLIEQEVNHIEVIPSATPGTPTQQRKREVFFLYCRHGLVKDNLEDLLEILGLFFGIVPHSDLNVTEHPANWNRWVEKQITSCDYVLLICTEQLHGALTGENDTLVEMFTGKCNSNSIIDCIHPSKIIPVFIDCLEDRGLIPMRLHDRKSFELNLTDLLNTVQNRNDIDSLQLAIRYNSDFKAFRELFELLQM